MDMRKRLFFSVSVLPILFSVFSSTLVLEARATDPPGQTYTLTSAQTVALFGNSIPCTYYAQGTTETNYLPFYKSASFSYYSTSYDYINSGFYYSPDGYSYIDRRVCYYRMPLPSDWVDNTTFTVEFQTSVELSNLTYFDSALIFQNNQTFSLSASYDYYSSWSWYYTIDGSGYHSFPLRRGDDSSANYNLYGYISSTSWFGGESQLPIIPLSYNGASATLKTGYAYVMPYSSYGYLYIGIVCPVISSYDLVGNQAANGAGSGISESSGGGSESGSGDQSAAEIVAALDRMSEQQQQNLSEDGPLSWIGRKLSGLIGGIVDGIKDLFIPSNDTILAFKNSLDTKFHETFGAMYDADSLLQNALANLNTTTGLEAVSFPGLELPLHDASTGEDVTFELDPVSVPLKPQYNRFTFDNHEFPNLYECVAIAVDFVAVLLFINMLRNKLETILSGREVHDE